MTLSFFSAFFFRRPNECFPLSETEWAFTHDSMSSSPRIYQYAQRTHILVKGLFFFCIINYIQTMCTFDTSNFISLKENDTKEVHSRVLKVMTSFRE